MTTQNDDCQVHKSRHTPSIPTRGHCHLNWYCPPHHSFDHLPRLEWAAEAALRGFRFVAWAWAQCLFPCTCTFLLHFAICFINQKIVKLKAQHNLAEGNGIGSKLCRRFVSDPLSVGFISASRNDNDFSCRWNAPRSESKSNCAFKCYLIYPLYFFLVFVCVQVKFSVLILNTLKCWKRIDN